jgi:hypothetical protein
MPAPWRPVYGPMPSVALCEEPFEEARKGDLAICLAHGVNWTEMDEVILQPSKQRCQMAILQYLYSVRNVAHRWAASADALTGTLNQSVFTEDEIAVLRAFTGYGFGAGAVSEELHYRTEAECEAKVKELMESGELFLDTPVI